MAKVAGFGGAAHHGPPRAGDLQRNALDPRKAAKGLGWHPWTTMPEGIQDTIDWFRAQRG